MYANGTMDIHLQPLYGQTMAKIETCFLSFALNETVWVHLLGH